MKASTKFIKRECERIYENADRYLKKLYHIGFNKEEIQNKFECYLVERCHKDIDYLIVVAETETAMKCIDNLMKNLELRLLTTYRNGTCNVYGEIHNTYSYNTITNKFNAIKIDTKYNIQIVTPYVLRTNKRTADVYRTHHGNLMILLV